MCKQHQKSRKISGTFMAIDGSHQLDIYTQVEAQFFHQRDFSYGINISGQVTLHKVCESLITVVLLK